MARLIDQIVGHRDVWESLFAQKIAGRLAHALAFTGPPGVGKRKVAFALAQALVCDKESPPCGECGPCRRIESQGSESLLYIEPSSGTIKLEAAGQVLEFLSLQRIGRARIVIVEQAQLLNAQTANAMLKSIEEPPPETFFILLASEISQLLPTLRSRVQNVRFAPLPDSALRAAEVSAPEWMLRSARGSFELLEQFRSPEQAELRQLAIDFLNDAAADVRGALDKAQAEAKDRDLALSFTRLLQQILRDWSVMGENAAIHADLQPALAKLPAVAPDARVALWRAAYLMEGDMLAHVDRGLCLENFYYRTRRALR